VEGGGGGDRMEAAMHFIPGCMISMVCLQLGWFLNMLYQMLNVTQRHVEMSLALTKFLSRMRNDRQVNKHTLLQT
jgi:hypothetical protein